MGFFDGLFGAVSGAVGAVTGAVSGAASGAARAVSSVIPKPSSKPASSPPKPVSIPSIPLPVGVRAGTKAAARAIEEAQNRARWAAEAAAEAGSAVAKTVGSVAPKVALPKIELPGTGAPTGGLTGGGGLFKPTKPQANPVSGAVDAVIDTRDRFYYDAGHKIASGDQMGGGVQMAGTLAADVLLPLDTVNVANKWMTGRAGELETSDYLGMGADLLAVGLGAVTGGAGYLAVKGLKTTGKGGTSMLKLSKIMGGLEAGSKAAKTASVVPKTSSLASVIPKTRSVVPKTTVVPKINTQAYSRLNVPASGIKGGTVGGKAIASEFGAAGAASKSLKSGDAIGAGAKAETTTAEIFGKTEVKTTSAALETGVKGTDAALGGTEAAVKVSGSAPFWKQAITGAGLLGMGGILAGTLLGSGSPAEDPTIPPGATDPDGMDELAEYLQQLEDRMAALEAAGQGGDAADAEYIAALEQYIAELEQALQEGRITQEEYERLLREAQSEITDTEGGYFPPPWGGSEGDPYMMVEAPAQDITRYLDGVPIVGSILKAARRSGVALPALIAMGIVTVVGGRVIWRKWGKPAATKARKKIQPKPGVAG